MNELTGQRVFLTGAGGGLGAGLARVFAERGAVLGISDMSETGLDRVRGELRCWARQLDVTDAAQVRDVIAEFAGAHGGIDLLVNNAGLLTVAPVVDLDPADWRRVLEVNATGTFLVSQAVLREMIAREIAGSIICIASIAGKVGDPQLAHYSASKFAVIGFVQSLAREVAAQGITVNAVCPGIVDTPMIQELAKGWNCTLDDFLKNQLVKRTQTPAEIARAIVFLHRSRSITGQSLSVDGGTYFH